MAYKEAQGEDRNPMIKWSDDPEKKGVFLGEVVEGKYQSNKKVNTENGEATIYTIEIDGVAHDLWGTSLLNQRFNEGNEGSPIPLGVDMRISFLGQKKNKSGSRSYNIFKVEFEEDGVAILGGKEVKDKEDAQF